jgi:hypothetical protein
MVYVALVDQIAKLPPTAAGSVIEFYSNLQNARSLVEKLPSDLMTNGKTQIPPKWRTSNIEAAWKNAAYNGAKAIDCLEPLAKTGKQGDELKHLKKMKDELKSVGLAGSRPPA